MAGRDGNCAAGGAARIGRSRDGIAVKHEITGALDVINAWFKERCSLLHLNAGRVDPGAVLVTEEPGAGREGTTVHARQNTGFTHAQLPGDGQGGRRQSLERVLKGSGGRVP